MFLIFWTFENKTNVINFALKVNIMNVLMQETLLTIYLLILWTNDNHIFLSYVKLGKMIKIRVH